MSHWYLIRSALVFSLRVTRVVFCVLVSIHIVCALYLQSDIYITGFHARSWRWLFANVIGVLWQLLMGDSVLNMKMRRNTLPHGHPKNTTESKMTYAFGKS